MEKIMSNVIQSVAVLSAYVMMADGREDPEEWEALKPLAENQGFAWDDFKKEVEDSLKSLVQSEDAWTADSIINSSGYGLNPETIEILFDDLIDLVLADGAIDFGEIDVLVRVREILRLSETYLVTIFAMKVSAAAAKGKVIVTLNDRDKTPDEILQEIKAENQEELEEAA
jgi:uncharacterized tellurite resistance protein B-like protein